jgi:serine protease AprX
MRQLKVIVSILLILFSLAGIAQQNRYVVYLTDKSGSTHSLQNPETFLSTRAIQRRLQQGIRITEEDLPVSATYINTIKSLNVDVFYTSKWFNAVLIQTEADKISSLSALPFVEQVKYVAPGERLIRNGRMKFEEEQENVDLGINSFKQLVQLGIGDMHELGYRGEDINIAVIDGGFTGLTSNEFFEALLSQGRLKDAHNFVRNSNDPFQASQHGTMVLSTMAAYKSNDFIGGAYKANYFLYLSEDAPTEYIVEEYNWLFAAERADSAGVDIINTSLGYSWFDDPAMNYTPADMDGKTAVISRAAKIAFEKGILVVTSAGNYGSNNWKIITAPADVEEVLAIGAVTDTGLRSAFSSTGPTADGRLKPDLMAMGQAAAVISAAGTKSFVSGTSLSSPLLASLAAGLWQAYPKLSNKEIREALIRSGSQYTNPDILNGYGIPDFLRAKDWIEARFYNSFFSIYPNPTSDNNLFIRSLADDNSSLQITIINSAGQLVSKYVLNGAQYYGRYIIDVADINAGIYLVQITGAAGKQTLRWVKR